jgi:peptidoglycan/xylan/chitin deacetylase (PgdA/CDA1 family)
VIERVESAFDWMLGNGPAQRAAMVWSKPQATVLAYHAIVQPERFEDHLKFLLRHWRPISLDELIVSCHGVGELPRRAVLLTFDDGDRSLMDCALPLLRERGVPGLAFVISDLLESDRPPWWSEVEVLLATGGSSNRLPDLSGSQAVSALKRMPDADRESVVEELRVSALPGASRAEQLSRADLKELETGGIEIGNHTNTHPFLPRCPAARTEAEVREAHIALESALGHHPRAFAYPNGDWDPRAEAVLEELEYEVAFLFDHRINRLPIRNPLRISRLRVDSTTSMNRFRAIVSGLHPSLHRLRGGK